MPIVSVIIPVYNVEKYLRQCLDSIVNQTLRDIEIICVDDGSTDGSSAILAEYAAKDSRVKVLTREHTNAGAARNAGMAIATGEYLGFVDSDDWCELDMLAVLSGDADNKSADVVCSGKKLYSESRGVITRAELLPVSMCEDPQPRPAASEKMRLVPVCGVSVWNKLFRREYLDAQNIRFQSIERANDISFTMQALLLAERISFLREAYYIYRVERAGGLQTGNSSTPLAFAEALLDVKRSLKERGRYDDLRKAFANTALAHARYNLLHQTAERAFVELYHSLHDRLLVEFDVASLASDEFLYQSDATLYSIIRDNKSPYPLLLRMMKERNDRGGDLMALKAKVGVLNKELANANEVISGVNRELSNANRQLERANKLIEIRAVRCSVIMAVYNVEEFLAESIESILNQDIGRENLQLILVDDGSPDASGAICDEYARRHPSCVTVIHQENAGVAAARNAGLKMAVGKYVTFTDADDKLTHETCRLACDFLDSHEDDIDIASIPMKFFDGAKGEHILNYKFNKGVRVIDLAVDWDCPQLSMSSAFAKTELAARFGFDVRLAYAEDAKLALTIQGLKKRLGAVAGGACYLYRKRSTGAGSALQGSTMKKPWYLPPMEYFHQAMVKHFESGGSPLPAFVQFALAYDLQWRVKQPELPQGVLSSEDGQRYVDLIADTLRHIDNRFIIAQKHINAFQKFAMLRLKNGFVPSGCWFGWVLPRYDFLTRTDTGWRIEGTIPLYDGVDCSGMRVLADIGTDVIRVPLNRTPYHDIALGRTISHRYSFVIDVPSDALAPHDIKIWLDTGKKKFRFTSVTFGGFFPVSKRVPAAYCYSRGLKLSMGNGCFIVKRCGWLRLLKAELVYLRNLCRIADPYAHKAVFARLAYWSRRLFKFRKLWLLSDRVDAAGDNGEALFRYLAANPVKDVDTVFVLGRNAQQYDELSKIGKVVESGSWSHKFTHLLSDCVISSQAGAEVLRPIYNIEYYRDIRWNKKFVFLQHGITKDDLSRWLNRYSKDISGFITAARAEYDSIVNGDYGYGPDRVWLTGFARFDLLESKPSKRILLMPTWRMTLTSGLDRDAGKWKMRDDFADTEFVKFYNALFSDQRLCDACRRFGYQVLFVPHPNLMAGIDAFKAGEHVEIVADGRSYRQLFSEGDLLVTDYSSTAFDFAYLRKPVVYVQFDEEDFFSGTHAYEKGYFDYRRDGFGEVETTFEGTIDRIIEYMESGCRLKPEFKRRIDGFFEYGDRCNCRRIVERLENLMFGSNNA